MSDLSVWVLLALVIVAFTGGIGITAIGPGGVLPTIALFALTSLPPDRVAGTAIVTHVATGLLGTAVYLRSGQLRDPATRRTAGVLALAAVIGTPAGVMINAHVSDRLFGLILGGCAAAVALVLWRKGPVRGDVTPSHPPAAIVAIVGIGVAVAAGIVGIGGPMLSVPILVALSTPMLEALAAAQVQSVVVSGTGTLTYAAHGSIDWPLALLIGIPELAGVALGWSIARVVPVERLKAGLIVALLVLAPYLMLKP